MSLSKAARNLVVIALALLASGCGFQLQGAFSPPQEMERTYVNAVDSHSRFYRALSKSLEDAGVNLVKSADEATAILSITFDETDQRVLSVSGRNTPTEYEVYYTVEYAIDAEQNSILESQTLTLTRDYTYDPTLVLGKAREEELLREAIVNDLVRIVLKQISTL